LVFHLIYTIDNIKIFSYIDENIFNIDEKYFYIETIIKAKIKITCNNKSVIIRIIRGLNKIKS
jgi:hypothetical protein